MRRWRVEAEDVDLSARNTRRMPEQADPRVAPLVKAGDHFLLRPDITFLNHGNYGVSNSRLRDLTALAAPAEV
jgi:hypothetical protein